jgi:hypothetical protein
MKNMKNSKNLVLAVIAAVILTAPSAYAGAVTNWTGTDGFSAQPYQPGTNILHLRLDSNFPGNSSGNALMPGINLTTSFIEGLDMGIGGGLNFYSLGTSFNNFSTGAIYPWVRVAVPLGIENIKTGIMVGTSVPIETNAPQNVKYNNSRSANEFIPGITGLLDVFLGQLTKSEPPVTLGLNAGYARGLTSGTNLLSGNLNLTVPYANLIFYEEQFVNVPVGNYANGGFRIGLNIPVGDRFIIDVKPAGLWDINSNGVSWTFNPSVGASMKF